jgi:carboxylesterase type B
LAASTLVAALASVFEPFRNATFAAGGHGAAARMRGAGFPACYYHFSDPAQRRRAAWGAYPGLELWFLDDEFERAWWGEATAEDLAFTQRLIGVWIHFAKSGEPGAPGTPPWDCRTPAAAQAYELAAHFGPIPTPRLHDALTF